MASSGSAYSSDAPGDFHLSSSIEDSGSRFSTSVDKCPLCSYNRKTFYCKQCIQEGSFIHSNNHYAERYRSVKYYCISLRHGCFGPYEKFAEKRVQLLNWQNNKKQLQDLCNKLLQKHVRSDQLRTEIDACHERIELLRMLIQEKKKNLEEGKPKISSMVKQSQERSARLPRYEERVCKLERYVNQMEMNVTTQAEGVQRVQQQLKDVIRASIQQLVQYIFPIIPVQPVPTLEQTYWTVDSDEDCDVPRDTVTALADATRTAYIRGRWVFTDSSGQLQHCIVAPSLPDSGDYSAYSVWVAANKDGVPGGSSDNVDNNPAYNISAALTYTTQLVNVLAFYLDVRLPNKLCYSDFCGHEMTDSQFAHRVAKLNSNVLHLCFTQNVNPELLHPAHTLNNILLLLNTEVSDLGRLHQHLVDDVNMLGENPQTIRENMEILLEANKAIGLEVNPEKIKYMIMSHDQNIVRNGNIKIGDLSFKEVEKFKYLGATVTNINDTREEIKCRINMENACCYSIEKLLSSSLLSKNLNVNTQSITSELDPSFGKTEERTKVSQGHGASSRITTLPWHTDQLTRIQGPLEVDPVLAKSLEDQLSRDLEIGEDSGSDDESDTLPWEWEAKLLSSSLLSKNLKVRIYKTVILPAVLYGCETWTLTLREEQRLGVFENKVLRKIFGAKRDEVTGEWRKLHNGELHSVYSSPDIIRNIKSRRLRWAGHVARMGESRNEYRVLVGRPEGKRPLARPRRRWEDNIKMDLREVGYDGRDWINLAQDRDQWRAYVRTAMNLRVPHVPCPESTPGPSQVSQHNLTSTQQATSMAGGLVTSAAASIASFWRGWTGTK
ncbi:hypothetical protein ANN_17434 [Periplaneta americana]|uniref:Beclin 1-associated autophagy-related key regulator n=1 Tax=Periplaneta americana TaxID=6978 RepID=A0ABQ8SU86_PERAM|nr:hypothetical protein ANN_17434 [Periplaneta americana]